MFDMLLLLTDICCRSSFLLLIRLLCQTIQTLCKIRKFCYLVTWLLSTWRSEPLLHSCLNRWLRPCCVFGVLLVLDKFCMGLQISSWSFSIIHLSLCLEGESLTWWSYCSITVICFTSVSCWIVWYKAS